MMAEAEIRDKSTPVYYSSNGGGTKLELKGFMYNKDRTFESKVYWRCEDRKCIGQNKIMLLQFCSIQFRYILYTSFTNYRCILITDVFRFLQMTIA